MSVENTAITNLTLSKCFKQFGVNVHVYGTVEEPLFLAKEICLAVGLNKYRDKIKILDDDERCPVQVDTLRGTQTKTAVKESGVYKILLTCRAAKIKGTPANRFMNWVVKVVLPSIRRTGSFEINRLTAEVAAVTAEVVAVTAQVARLTVQRDSVIRCVEVSPFKLLVAQITGEPYANNWKGAGQAVSDTVFRIWNVAKEQNRVEQLTPDACWTFASTLFRDTWNVFVVHNR